MQSAAQAHEVGGNESENPKQIRTSTCEQTIQEDLNGVILQPSNGVKSNHPPSKKVNFYCSHLSKMEININRQNVSRHFNLTNSADLF